MARAWRVHGACMACAQRVRSTSSHRTEHTCCRREAPPPEARGVCCGASLGGHLETHLIPDYVHVPSQRQHYGEHRGALSAAAAGEARCSCSAEQREQVSQAHLDYISLRPLDYCLDYIPLRPLP